MSQSISSYTVENVDISNDEEPVLYIQRYKYPKRTYRVVRKAWDEAVEGEFIPDPEYSESYWHIDILLLAEYDPEDGFTEIFASVDRDEEHPPLDDPEEVKSQNSDACFHVVYGVTILFGAKHTLRRQREGTGEQSGSGMSISACFSSK